MRAAVLAASLLIGLGAAAEASAQAGAPTGQPRLGAPPPVRHFDRGALRDRQEARERAARLARGNDPTRDIWSGFSWMSQPHYPEARRAGGHMARSHMPESRLPKSRMPKSRMPKSRLPQGIAAF